MIPGPSAPGVSPPSLEQGREETGPRRRRTRRSDARRGAEGRSEASIPRILGFGQRKGCEVDICKQICAGRLGDSGRAKGRGDGLGAGFQAREQGDLA